MTLSNYLKKTRAKIHKEQTKRTKERYILGQKKAKNKKTTKIFDNVK